MSSYEENMSQALLMLSKALKTIKQDVDGSEGDNRLEIMKGEMRKILIELSKDKDDFHIIDIQTLIKQYRDKYGRLLYSEITSYSYELSESDSEKYARFLSNIERLLESYVNKDQKCENEDTKLVIKIWDHVNLANSQFTKLKLSDEFISEQFAIKIKPILDESETTKEELEKTKKDLDSSKKELYSQLISIVSIFVAISFVMFGGMSLMNNLFDYSALKRIPLLEMLCAGSLIGIVMIFAIYAFIVFILRITGKLDYTLEEKEEIKKISDYINELHSDDKENEDLKKELTKYLKDKKYIKLPYRRLVVILCLILLLIMGISGITCIWQSGAYPQQQIEESETVQETVIQPDQDNNFNQEVESTGNNQSIETNKK